MCIEKVGRASELVEVRNVVYLNSFHANREREGVENFRL